MRMDDTELYALIKQLDSSITINDLIESVTITDNFEFYGKTSLSNFPENVFDSEFIDKFNRFGGIIKGSSYIIPAGLEVAVSVNKSDGLIDMKRNGATLTINGRMGDVCKFELNPTKLGNIVFEALKFHGYDTKYVVNVIEEITFYSKLFGVNIDSLN